MRLQLSNHQQPLGDGLIARTPPSTARMRTVDPHLLEDKMDEAVTHYINSNETVHVDTSGLALNVQDGSSNRVVTVMHSQNFPPQMCRQVTVGEQVGEGPWSEELLDPDGRFAALVAQIAQNSRPTHQALPHHKVPSVRSDVDPSVMLESPLRLFNGHSLEPHQEQESLVVEVPSLALPPLQQMKRCPDGDWFNKTKTVLKEPAPLLPLGAASPLQRLPPRKSLPHKKRISRKLKRNPNHSDHLEDNIVVINCHGDTPHEEILPDSYVGVAPPHHAGPAEVRAILICQICGEFYGEEQLKFYQHLKQHYEPHATIIIENPAQDLGIDKMTNTCIVDNVQTLPDSIVELSLENTMPKTTIYQPIDKQILYSTNDKTLYTNTKSYSMTSIDNKEESPKDIYETVEKVEVYSCVRCNKSFRKQKHCEAHIMEMHSKEMEEMSEFSEPEDLMEGIHVAVEEELEPLPTLTVDNGAVRQDHARQWYMSRGSSCDEAPCSLCVPRGKAGQDQLKEEIIQRIFESEVQHDPPSFVPSMQDTQEPLDPHDPHDLNNPNDPHDHNNPNDPIDIPEARAEVETKPVEEEKKGKRTKQLDCQLCGRVFKHRNSLLYHTLSHSGEKQHACTHCKKTFYTRTSLTIHERVHSGSRPYSCSHCGRSFRQWGDLKYHTSSLHSGVKKYKCDFCGKQFARKYSLNVHRRIHTGEKDYQCPHCSKAFRTSSYRDMHVRTHTGYKPHKCPTCDKAFRVRADLKRHQLIHDKNKNATDKKDDKPEIVKSEPTEEKKEVKVKKIATASTTKLPVPKPETSKKPKKTKKGAPNVVVNKDGEPEYGEVREVYSDQNIVVEIYCKDSQREFATLRPILRGASPLKMEEGVPSPQEKQEPKENTDGKLAVFTHMEAKGRSYQSNIGADLRNNLELRDRGEGEAENGFIERLTALYNITA